MEDLKNIVARNLAACRKEAGLTQLQLAERLNYSDKAISKWERGDSLPDLTVLSELACLYGVTLDYLVAEHADKRPVLYGKLKKRTHIFVTVMSSLLVWFIATLLFSLLYLFQTQAEGQWLLFIWALPVNGILLVVFAGIWGNRVLRTLAVSFLVWTTALALFFTLPMQNAWLVFVVAAPLQVLAVFWFFLRAQKAKIK